MFHLTRTIWPVGHGAFYTECLHFRNTNSPISIVYDCGGKSKELIEKQVDHFLHYVRENDCHKPIVDFLCISHFHNDHVSGLSYILSNADVKHLILPQFSMDALVEAFVYNAFQFGPSNSCDVDSDVQHLISRMAQSDNGYGVLDTRAQITQVITNQEHEQNQEATDAEDLTDRISGGRKIVITHVDTPNPEGTTISQQWILVPVYLSYPIDKFHHLLDGLNKLAEDNNLNSVCDANHIVNWNNLKELLRTVKPSNVKVCYEKYYGSDNAYSMPVYSGWENPTFVCDPAYQVHMSAIYDYYDEFPFMWSSRYWWRHRWNDYRQFQCLYMGDFETNKKFDLLYGQLRQWWTEIGMQQIPHHVSKNNHDARLYCGLHKFCFGNVDENKDRSFCWSILKSILHCGCSPWIVTEDDDPLVQEVDIF